MIEPFGVASPFLKIADPTNQWVILGASAASFLALVVYGVIDWRRRGSPVLVLATFGGAVATLIEPMYDLVARIYMYQRGAHVLFTVGGRGMQLWAPLGYGTYIGVCVFIFYRLASSPTTTRRTYWRAVGAILALNLAIEIPGTRLGLYEYFGPQAFDLTGFPLYWLVQNIAGGIAAGVILARLGSLTRGWRALSIVLLVPSCFVAGELFVGWPAFAAVGMTNTSYVVVYVGAMFTLAIGAAWLVAFARLCAPNPAASRRRDASPIEVGGLIPEVLDDLAV